MAENKSLDQSLPAPEEPTAGIGDVTDNGTITHGVSEEDIANNPELSTAGVGVGDELELLTTNPTAGTSQPNPPFPGSDNLPQQSPEEGDQAQEEDPAQYRDTGNLYTDGLLNRDHKI